MREKNPLWNSKHKQNPLYLLWSYTVSFTCGVLRNSFSDGAWPFCVSACFGTVHTQTVVFLQVGYSVISHFTAIAGWQCHCPLFWVAIICQISFAWLLFFKVTPYPESTGRRAQVRGDESTSSLRAPAWKLIRCVMEETAAFWNICSKILSN